MKRLRLLTNLSYATVFPTGDLEARSVRCSVSAVLIEDPYREGEAGYMGGDQARVRGFGPDPAWPAFDVRLACEADEFEEAPWESGAVLVGESGDARPIGGGDMLKFADGLAVALWREDTDRPIHVDVWDDHDYKGAWKTLTLRVTDYWRAPAMPVLQYLDAGAMRKHRGVTA